MFLRNAWYVAAYGDEVGANLLGRRILDEPVLLYRKTNGSVVAIGDRCPHRFAPLHVGMRHGDTIQCAYHGLVFDAAGACIFNPHGNGKIPATAVVRTYAVAERNGLIWIWPGAVERASTDSIVPLDHLDREHRRSLGGYLRVDAHYQIITDNLLDLSHAQFLHADFQRLDWFNGRHDLRQDGDTIVSSSWVADSAASPLQAKNLPDLAMNVDTWFDVTWHPPSTVTIRSGFVPAGVARPADDPSIGTHLLTPETATTTHYFYQTSRNYLIDSPDVDERLRTWQRIGFEQQDRPMLEAVSGMMAGEPDIFKLNPVLLSSDAAAIRARRALAAAIERERGTDSPARLSAIPL